MKLNIMLFCIRYELLTSFCPTLTHEIMQLEGIVEYIRSAQTEPAKFDPATYRAKVDEILVPIMQHLSDELDTLESSKVNHNSL
jgi:hypothetical protein